MRAPSVSSRRDSFERHPVIVVPVNEFSSPVSLLSFRLDRSSEAPSNQSGSKTSSILMERTYSSVNPTKTNRCSTRSCATFM